MEPVDTSSIWNTLDTLVTEINYLNGGVSVSNWERTMGSGVQVPYYLRKGPTDIDEIETFPNLPLCASVIGALSDKCSSCMDFNVIHDEETLECINMAGVLTGLMSSCESALDEKTCRVCKSGTLTHRYYHDPMRRGMCRHLDEKCPVGGGFFKIDHLQTDDYGRRSCITCPLNCMVCHYFNPT